MRRMKTLRIAKKLQTVNSNEVVKVSDYDNAIESIKCAIDSLGEALQKDRSDKVARESIANLGVVLLDLKK